MCVLDEKSGKSRIFLKSVISLKWVIKIRLCISVNLCNKLLIVIYGLGICLLFLNYFDFE